jgi:hypothetical protein
MLRDTADFTRIHDAQSMMGQLRKRIISLIMFADVVNRSINVCL